MVKEYLKVNGTQEFEGWGYEVVWDKSTTELSNNK